MIWLAWRQFRTQGLVTLGLLAAFAVLVLTTGVHLRDVPASMAGGYEKTLSDLLGPTLLVIPALLGMFWGAPLIARELEGGTYRLAWTQSVTRRRWLTVKVALVGAAALAIAGLATWLVSWWFAPIDAVNMNRFDPAVFTERGIVAIGYAGFAFALGVAAGAVTRRTLSAMAVTLLGFIAARLAFTFWVRSHLLAASHTVLSLTQANNVGFRETPTSSTVFASLPTIPNAWPLSATLVGHARHPASTAQIHALLVRYCPAIAAGPPPNAGAGVGKSPAGLTGGVFVPCLNALSHHLAVLVTYQPASRYWPLQTLETAIFLAAALALIGATVWRLGRRATRTPGLPVGPTEAAANPLAAETSVPPARLPEGGARSARLQRRRTTPSRRPRL